VATKGYGCVGHWLLANLKSVLYEESLASITMTILVPNAHTREFVALVWVLVCDVSTKE
jgi:hypothetical protein